MLLAKFNGCPYIWQPFHTCVFIAQNRGYSSASIQTVTITENINIGKNIGETYAVKSIPHECKLHTNSGFFVVTAMLLSQF